MASGTRAPRLFALLAVLGVLAVGGAAGWAAWGARVPRPNLVLIVWDACRADRIGALGYPLPTTPRFDALARESVLYARCFTPSPWTPPAHASLFTGLLPSSHGLREGRGDRVNPGIPLLAETLAAAGYETAGFVANPQVSALRGLDRGFGTFRVLQGGDRAGTAEEVLGAAGEWIAARRESGRTGPVFLFVNLMETHSPYAHHPADVAAVHGERAVEGARRAAEAVGEREEIAHNLRHRVLGPDELAALRVAYDGAVRSVDRATGDLLDRLRGAGLLDGALLAITADHGENLGEHGDLGHLLSLREPVLHVPLLVRWPDGAGAGRREEAEVRLQDLYPTLLRAARVGIPGPCGLDAEPLGPGPVSPRTLVAEFGPFGENIPVARHANPDIPATLFGRYHLALRAVREPRSAGARKLLAVDRHDRQGPAEHLRDELHDLAADPWEERDLLAEKDPALRDMEARDRLRRVLERGR